MKKLLSLLLFLPFLGSAQNATIKFDVNRVIGEIDPKIYGVFMEPIEFDGARMGRPDLERYNTLYGPLYDPSSPLANEDGFRKDYIDAFRELKITNMRWPGGNFVMGYDWRDGIGPKDQRPARINLAWGGVETNHVATDEWIALNTAIGSENVVCVNLGLSGIIEAVHWLEYCNYKGGTYYSDLRAKYGHAEPYNIKIWDLGNEVDGEPWELGYKNADDYVKIAREAAKAMKAVDSSIELVVSGSSYYEESGIWLDWNRTIINELRDIADYVSIHRYWERSDDYYEYVGNGALDIEEKINALRAQITLAKTRYSDAKAMYLSVDEYAAFGQTMMSTLAATMYLNSFIRHADIVKMANYTLATSLVGSDPEKGTFKTPLFHAFKLFSNNCHGASVDTHVVCDTFSTEKFNGIPYLDVTTVYSGEENAVIINVVNRHKDKTITADMRPVSGTFAGKATATTVNSASLNDSFTFENKDKYDVEMQEVKPVKETLSVAFPPHSFTQVKVSLKN